MMAKSFSSFIAMNRTQRRKRAPTAADSATMSPDNIITNDSCSDFEDEEYDDYYENGHQKYFNNTNEDKEQILVDEFIDKVFEQELQGSFQQVDITTFRNHSSLSTNNNTSSGESDDDIYRDETTRRRNVRDHNNFVNNSPTNYSSRGEVVEREFELFRTNRTDQIMQEPIDGYAGSQSRMEVRLDSSRYVNNSETTTAAIESRSRKSFLSNHSDINLCSEDEYIDPAAVDVISTNGSKNSEPMDNVRDPRSLNPAHDSYPSNGTSQQFPVQYSNKQLPESVTWHEERVVAGLRERSFSDPLIHGTDLDGPGALSPRNSGAHSGRKRYSSQQTLPTLDETTDAVCASPFGPLSFSNTNSSDDLKIKDIGKFSSIDSPVKSLRESSSPLKKSFNSKAKKSRLDKVKELQAAASDLAQRGDEEEALKTYRKALQVAASEMSRIKSQINKSKQGTFKSKFSSNSGSPLPIAAIQSIQKRIQEDLIAISDRIGKIRIVMTILYERMGEYEKAIESCKEATEVYKHQQLLNAESESETEKDSISRNGNDNGQHKPKSAKERLRDTKKMMQRLELGRSCYNQRQHVTDEMTELRHQISDVVDMQERNQLLLQLYDVAQKQLNSETKALGKSHPQIADPLQLMSTISLEMDNVDDGSQYLVNAFKVLKANLGMKHPKTAMICIKIAKLHRSILDSLRSRGVPHENLQLHEDMTMEYFTHATNILRASKLRPTQLGSTLNDLAIMYMKRREYNMAIELLKEALQRYEENSESLTTSVAMDLIAAGSSSNLCSVDDLTGEETLTSSTSNSVSSHSDSGESITPPRHNGNLSIDALQVWRNLGESYFQVEQFDEAKEAFANALEIQRSTRTIHDAVSELDLGIVGVEAGMMRLVDDSSIVDTLSRLGKACGASGKHQEALMYHKECLELMNRIAVEEELYRTLSNHQVLMRQQQLSSTLYSIGNACSEIERYDDAKKFYSEAIQHCRLRTASLLDDRNNRINKRQEAAHCALCFTGIGNVHMKQEKYPEALKIYNDALVYCETKGLESYHPAVVTLLQKKKETEQKITELPRSNALVARLEARALEEMTAGLLDESILTLTEAMGILRSSFAQAKLAGFDSSEHLCAIARMLQTLASVFLEKGEEENAERVFLDAVRLFKQSGAEDKLDV